MAKLKNLVISNRYIILIILIGLLFRLYNINNRYSFDWDQQDDSIKIMEMINQKKPKLIGPRVASEDSFFNGPLHYYVLTPFYLLTKGDPIAGAYAAITIDVLKILVVYFVTKSIFNPKAAIYSAFLIAINYLFVSWTAMYAPIFALLIFYLCHKLFQQSNAKYVPIIIFIFALATATHLSSASLFIPILFTIIFSKSKLSPKTICLSLILFFIPFIPIIIFDLRHDFLNTRQIINLLSRNNQPTDYSSVLFYTTFKNSLGLLYQQPSNTEKLLAFIVLIFGSLSLKNIKSKILSLLWILSPILLLSFYRGAISEYYYSSVTIFIIVYLGYILSLIQTKQPVWLIYILLLFFITKTHYLVNDHNPSSLKNKKEIVSYLVTQKTDPFFNVSYDLPLGTDNGYQYLFTYYKKEPQNIPQAHLYTISPIYDLPTGQLVYQSGNLAVVRR